MALLVQLYSFFGAAGSPPPVDSCFPCPCADFSAAPAGFSRYCTISEPVCISGGRRIRLGVRVPFDRHMIRQLAQLLRQGPSPLIFALPLSKNVPVADSVSSMRRPSFVTVMSMWLSNLSNLGTSRIDFRSCAFTPADKSRSLVAMSSERPKLFLLTLGTLETNGRRAKRG